MSAVRSLRPPAENIILDFRHPLPRRYLLHTEVLWLVPQLVICRTFIGRIHFKLRFILGVFLSSILRIKKKYRKNKKLW